MSNSAGRSSYAISIAATAATRGLLGVGGDRGDRLAPVPHLALGEQRLVGRHAETLEMAVDVLGNVDMGDHRADALHRFGLGRVEPRDHGMVVRGAQRLHPQSPPHAYIVDVLGAPRDVGDTVVARQAGADGLHAALPSAESNSTGSTSPRDAASTAVDDLHVAGAAAVVPAEPFEHVLALERAARALDQRRGRDHHARRAEAALRGVVVVERRLNGRQRFGFTEALDRRDLGAVDRRDRREA